MNVRLRGLTVVVTRPAVGPDALADRLRALGAEVRELPAIELGPPEDPAPLDAALRTLDRFDWVAFASAAGVERVLARLGELSLPAASLSTRSLAVVGPATAARLAERLRAPDLVAAEATGAALAAALGPRVRGRRVLLPRPAEARPELLDGLTAAGAEVTPVVAYRTLPVAAARLAPLRAWLAAGEVQAVTFASPSAVEAVAASLGAEVGLLSRAVLGAIGPTTAAALRAHGLEPGAVPDQHTGEGLAEALAVRLG